MPVMLAMANARVSLAPAAHASRILMLHKVWYCAKIK